MTATARAARSHLFAPAGNERILGKVVAAGADAVVLDLEDAVAPAEKTAARRMLAGFLGARTTVDGPPIWVRINGTETDLWRDDLRAVVGPWLTGVRIPKAESADAVRRIIEALAEDEVRAGLEAGSVAVALTIESALGAVGCNRLASCERVAFFTFGNMDFLADIGARDSEDGIAALYAHSRVVLASRAAGIAAPVAPVYTRLDDVDGLRASTEHYKRLGFFGRSCIHPRQLAVVHEVFTPSPEEVREAEEIVASYRRGLASASGVEVTGSGQFVDVAVVRRAEAVLALVRSIATGEEDR